ncbi:MAG TPA: Spy/CpxP family protein refolding chaperone [Terriglobales bacterium]|nr:Spy/CpxP family protein refolding chaperone [Terriglobales bacterium]
MGFIPFFRLLGLVLVLSCAGAAMAQDKPATEPPAAKESEGLSEQATRRLWWNRSSMIEALKLTVHQREKMDAKFAEHYAKERAAREQSRELRRAYDSDLEKGHWGGARQTAQRLIAVQSQALDSQYSGRIEVLALLTDEQREQLATSRGRRLLTANWLGRTGGGPGMRRDRHRRQSQETKQVPAK